MEPIIAEQNTSDVIDVTMDSFMAEVVEASNQKIVILQFWARCFLVICFPETSK